AQRETHPATAKAMTALASDYTDLVASQSGAAQLPDMSTVQNDGTAFDKACSLSFTTLACRYAPSGRPWHEQLFRHAFDMSPRMTHMSRTMTKNPPGMRLLSSVSV